jgi:hypothetical protein
LRFAVHREALRIRGAPCLDVPGRVRAEVDGKGARAGREGARAPGEVERARREPPGGGADQAPGEVKRRLMPAGCASPRRP